MIFEIILTWIFIGLFSYVLAFFGMDRIFGEYKIDLLVGEETRKKPSFCPICKKVLTTWFYQCVDCLVCSRRICRGCAEYLCTIGEWKCQTCSDDDKISIKYIYPSSRYWHDTILLEKHETDFSKLTLENNQWLDEVSKEAHELISSIISKELNVSIDELHSTAVGKLYKDPKYDLLFTKFHEALSIEIQEILCIFKLALHEKQNPDITNTRLSLQATIKRIKKTVMEVPQFELDPIHGNSGANSGTISNKKNIGRSYSPAYPDILSTAILNRIIIEGQPNTNTFKCISPISNDSAVLTDYTSTDLMEGSAGSQASGKDTQNWVMSSNGSVVTGRTLDDEEESNESNTPGSIESWSAAEDNRGLGFGKPQHFMIEESVEEITTTTYESESEASSINSENEESDGLELGDQKSSLQSVQERIANWEQNWLFKRRKEVLRHRSEGRHVTMLVPNPVDFNIREPMIGDEKASDMEDLDEDINVEELDFVLVQSSDLHTEEEEENETFVISSKKNDVPTSSIQNQDQAPGISEITLRKKSCPRNSREQVISEECQPIDSNSGSEESSYKKLMQVENALCEAESEVKNVQSLELSPMKIEEKAEENACSTTQIRLPNELIEIESARTISGGCKSVPEFKPPAVRMRIAEREKEKWNHPVSVKYNPYAVENLNKRIKERESMPLPTAITIEDDQNAQNETGFDDFKPGRQNINRFRRDYYVNTVIDDKKRSSFSTQSEDLKINKNMDDIKEKIYLPTANSIEKDSKLNKKFAASTPSLTTLVTQPQTYSGLVRNCESGNDLNEIKLPSVKNLAMKFAYASTADLSTHEVSNKQKSIGFNMGVPLKQQEQIKPRIPRTRIENSGIGSSIKVEKSLETPIPVGQTHKLDIGLELLVLDSEIKQKLPEHPELVEFQKRKDYQDLEQGSDKIETVDPLYKADSEINDNTWVSAKALISSLESKAKDSNVTFSQLPSKLQRSKSLNESTRPKHAMEVLSTQPIRKQSSEYEYKDLKKLKRLIVRGSRNRHGLSSQRQKEFEEFDCQPPMQAMPITAPTTPDGLKDEIKLDVPEDEYTA